MLQKELVKITEAMENILSNGNLDGEVFLPDIPYFSQFTLDPLYADTPTVVLKLCDNKNTVYLGCDLDGYSNLAVNHRVVLKNDISITTDNIWEILEEIALLFKCGCLDKLNTVYPTPFVYPFYDYDDEDDYDNGPF